MGTGGEPGDGRVAPGIGIGKVHREVLNLEGKSHTCEG